MPAENKVGEYALASPTLTFAVDGTEILATASADLTDTVPYPSNVSKAWNSMAQAVVRTRPGATVTVSAKGLKPQTCTIDVANP